MYKRQGRGGAGESRDGVREEEVEGGLGVEEIKGTVVGVSPFGADSQSTAHARGGVGEGWCDGGDVGRATKDKLL